MGTLGAWAAWWLTGRLVLQALCGRVPALALTGVTCQRSHWLCCTEHPAPWCQFRTLWDVQGDASRHPCVSMAMVAALGPPGEAAKQTPGVPGQHSIGLLSSAYLELVLICNSLIACNDLGLSLLRS